MEAGMTLGGNENLPALFKACARALKPSAAQ
jgi:hypothetical protein